MPADSYLAKPSGECCLRGSIHSGEPRGSYATITDIKTYISKPAGGKANGHIVLYFPDVYGLFTNGLLIMDAFADAGYLVLGLNYFMDDPYWIDGKGKQPMEDFQAWLAKHTAFADAALPKWVDEVKKQYGKENTKYACVGYCFGAPYVCNELAGNTVSAGAFAHPAFLKEHHFRNIKKPLLLSCAQTDHTFDTESRNQAVDILNGDNKSYQMQLFSGVEHGFALRGNMDNPYERHVKEQSLRGIIDWFDFWLSQ